MNKILLTILAGVIVMSCGDRLAELNNNPNVSLDASAPETFTSGIAFYGIALDAYYNENDALFAQYNAGGPGVALIDFERYFLEPGDFNTEWGFSYNQALSDLSFAVKQEDNVTLSAVADIFSVVIYQNLVDHYGDVPYFDALNGELVNGGITAPAYDNGKLIYDDLITRLDASIATLADPLNTSVLGDENGDGQESAAEALDGNEDVLYSGDKDNWIAFANSLKLRLLMRQSITDASVGAAVIDLIATGTFIGTDAPDAVIPFSGGAASNGNPQWARRSGGVGQFYCMSQTLLHQMTEFNNPIDPTLGRFVNDNRLFGMYAPADNGDLDGDGLDYEGLKQGNVDDVIAPSAGDYSFPTSIAYAETNDVIVISDVEVYFLRAEAAMRFGTADDELAMYTAAVNASFSRSGGGSAVGYLAGPGLYDIAASTDQKSNLIGVEKWKAMNGLQESEGWIEMRRFDTPSGGNVFTNASSGILVTPTQSTLAANTYPTIRLYPQSELDFNAANVPARTGTAFANQKVFWDN